MILPIEIIGGNPIRFKWKATIETPIGTKTVEYSGMLLNSAEQAVADLISIAKQQAQEIQALKKQIEGHTSRIAAQSELLSKRAEVTKQKGK